MLSDILDRICDYEAGEMDHDDMVAFFQTLIDTGMINQLQGSYGRTANNLVKLGLCHV